jgi:hypothetical protein
MIFIDRVPRWLGYFGRRAVVLGLEARREKRDLRPHGMAR